MPTAIGLGFRLILLLVCLINLSALSIYQTVAAEYLIERIYVFGDSASDTGNLAASLNFSLPDPPFYRATRISNGPVAVEVMASEFNLMLKPSLHLTGSQVHQGSNYAVAGARASAVSDDSRGLTTQVSSFIQQQGGSISSRSLYVIYIGANDIRDALLLTSQQARLKLLDQAVDNIELSLKQLIQAGARHFFIVNAPNIARAPELIAIAKKSANPKLLNVATALTRSFNRKLHRLLPQLRANKPSIKVSHEKRKLRLHWFNLFQLVDFIVENAEIFGFSVSDQACYNSTTFEFLRACENGKNFSHYIFFDDLHFSTIMHKIIGKVMAKKLMNKGYQSSSDHE